MVELPRYVHAKRRRGGLELSFQKYRGTDSAWPRVKLPSNPLSAEFVKKIALCARLEATKTPGGWTWVFIDEMDRRHDLPAPQPDSEAFWRAVERAEAVGKELLAGVRKTFSALIAEFKASAAYQLNIDEDGKSRPGLAESTRDQYERNLDDIEEAWGSDPVAELTPVDVQKAIDAFRDTPSAGRVFRSVLSRLCSWGIPRGYGTSNPVEHTETSENAGTYDPWTPAAFEHFFQHARIGLHLPVYSGLFTGQRLSDVIEMRRPREGVTEMPLVAQKTGELVPVQIHSEYRAIIQAQKSDHAMLHLREDGEPWTYYGFKTAWQREMNRPEFEVFRKHRWVFHGTRKNSVNNLLEVGCSEARVAAIVNMSPAMVHHYSKKVSQFRLARAAMEQFEEGWAKLRPSVLGNVKIVGKE
ncbi:hypothetical protein WN73_38615 [Bradyrhizobium sp. CCBAU 45394]|uniref:integrase n=1 Tax=Bradyrhizobium sp. CCBAU 45394 TaxID=1325087 RepID=UPI0023036D03|nr:integrase [Bradyrhizobium sp. CCBAU 45394]MDA9396426.1 hypothetical protein [Bradyrhizobium sp. CCBAU 45394]